MSACINCGCDDDHACTGGCGWIRLNHIEEIGVCSACPQAAARWDAGDRSFSDEAMDAIADRAELEHAASEPEILLPFDAEYSETMRYLRSR